MQSVIQGRLLYMKMVKGADNEVWRRLQRRFNRLSGAKPSTESAIIKYRYTIADFEKKIGQPLQFIKDNKGVLYGYFILNGNSTEVSFSHYARTRIANIVAKEENEQLTKLKKTYMLMLYEDRSGSFWRIERKRRWVEMPAVEELNAAMLNLFSTETVEFVENGDATASLGKPTDEVLAALIDFDFNLNTLDE